MDGFIESLQLHHQLLARRPNCAADALSRRQELAPDSPEEERPITLIPPSKFLEQITEVAGLSNDKLTTCLIAVLEAATWSDQQIQEQI
jgi:hypothetical protein